MIVKNIALAGHAGTGKTTLMEALLYTNGKTERFGNVAAGTTCSDYTSEEMRRKSSVYTAMGSIMAGEQKINLLDTPGMFDFAGGMVQGIAAADTVLITVSGKSGVRVGTKKAYKAAAGKPRMFVVTKLDDENANFYNVLTDLKTAFGPSVCPVVVPVIVNRQVDSYINLIEMKAYKYNEKGEKVEVPLPTAETSEKMGYRLDGLIEAFSEAVAETDESLFEKFFSGEEFTQKERTDGIHKGMKEGTITPVTCVAAGKLEGVDMLCKEFELLVPENSDSAIPAENAEGEILTLFPDDNAPVCAYIFETLADPFVGKLSFMRIISGTLKPGMELVNGTTGKTEKIGKIYFQCGKKQEEVAQATAGDLVAVTKLDASTGDALCDSAQVVSFAPMEFPIPSYKMAVNPATRGEESKIAAAIAKILEEDKTISYTQDPDTKEMILAGIGEQHLGAVTSKLKYDFGVEVVLSVPKIAYRETIRKKVKVQGRHKKQSGGHGQFGDVWMEFEPYPSDDVVFEEKIVGGAVPKNFFPAVEKGIQESVEHGVLAGFPVVGLKAILVDGSYHPVDSSEMAFKTAASIAYKEGMKQAEPVLLEPIGSLEVVIPSNSTGDIMGDLNKRRGRVLGMNPAEDEDMTVILAEVPIREMTDFTMQLRQMTQGEGTFGLTPVRYEQLPANLMGEVIAQSV